MSLDEDITCPKCSLRITAGVVRCHRCGARLISAWSPLARLFALGCLLIVLLMCAGLGAFLTSSEFTRIRLSRSSSLVDLREAAFEKTQSETGIEIPLNERSEILSNEIAKYARTGYQVVTRTETSAQLIKPKEFSFVAAVLWFLLFGIGLLIYLFYYMAKRDQAVYLVISKQGLISST